MKHKVQEKEDIRHVEKADIYEIDDFNGYDVRIEVSEDRGCEASIYPVDSTKWPKVGIIRCRPDSVDDLERLAEHLPALLAEIVKEMRAVGLGDLRDKWQRSWEEFEKEFQKRVA